MASNSVVSSSWLLGRLLATAYAAICVLLLAATVVVAQTEAELPRATTPSTTPWPPPAGAAALLKGEDNHAWTDAKRGVVIIDGTISLRNGPLEMFACLRNTKEHESIVSANTQAFPIHAALLALGAEPGGPVQFRPEYVPPSGTKIEIHIEWHDAEGKLQRARAQDWVRDLNTGKAMTHAWVFAGSLFWNDPDSGRQIYQAEGGDFICVSNFATAMLDIPVESTDANSGLFYEALTEQIPPLGTPVRLVLKPVLEAEQE